MTGEENQKSSTVRSLYRRIDVVDVDVGLALLDVNNHVAIGNVELNHVSSRVGPAEVGV